MNIWKRMDNCKDEFTPKEYEVYELVKKDPYAFSGSTAMEISSRYNISQSAISRFCQKIGYSGFADFRMSMVMETAVHSDNSDNPPTPETHDFSFYLQDIVRQTKNYLPDKLLQSLTERICNSNVVYVSGYVASHVAAEMLYLKLLSAKVPTHLIPYGSESETLRIMNNTDLVILFSAFNSSYKDFFNFISDLTPSERPYVILIANTNKHPLRNKADETIVLPYWHVLQYPYMLDTGLSQLMFNEFLTEHLMNHINNINK